LIFLRLFTIGAYTPKVSRHIYATKRAVEADFRLLRHASIFAAAAACFAHVTMRPPSFAASSLADIAAYRVTMPRATRRRQRAMILMLRF